MSNLFVANPPKLIGELNIVRDADWRTTFPQVLDGDQQPIDLTQYSRAMELWVLPSFAKSELIYKATSAAGEITYSDAANGYAELFVSRATVRTDIPIGRWKWFWLLIETVSMETFYWELMRGECIVSAGNVAAT